MVDIKDDDLEYNKIGSTELLKRKRAANIWFADKIKGASAKKIITPDDLLKRRAVNAPLVGQMLFFKYDAKHKDTLPYWDMYPLTILLNVDTKASSAGFLSLNTHYLPPSFRELLINRLLKTINDDRLDGRSKAKINYGLLKTASQFKFAQFALKKHLFSHIKSRVIRVPALEWREAIYLDLARWQKKTHMKVYTDFNAEQG